MPRTAQSIHSLKVGHTRKKYRFATCKAAVRYTLITSRRWWTGPSMQKEVKRLTGRLYSESGITARIRELRDEFYIPSRPKDESTSFEYRIELERKEAA